MPALWRQRAPRGAAAGCGPPLVAAVAALARGETAGGTDGTAADRRWVMRVPGRPAGRRECCSTGRGAHGANACDAPLRAAPAFPSVRPLLPPSAIRTPSRGNPSRTAGSPQPTAARRRPRPAAVARSDSELFGRYTDATWIAATADDSRARRRPPRSESLSAPGPRSARTRPTRSPPVASLCAGRARGLGPAGSGLCTGAQRRSTPPPPLFSFKEWGWGDRGAEGSETPHSTA